MFQSATFLQGDSLKISVSKSSAEKCVRCWHRNKSVGSSNKHQELCNRCEENLDGPGEDRSLLSIKKGYLVILFLIVIDLVSKFVAEENLVFGEAIPLIPILDLLLVFNSGIAFSIFDFNNNVFSFGLSLLGLMIVYYLHSLYKSEESSINRLSLILIIAGALGNILDRLPDGVVTDFLFFHVGNTSFFIFNFADAFISIGAALFFLTEFKKFLQNRSG